MNAQRQSGISWLKKSDIWSKCRGFESQCTFVSKVLGITMELGSVKVWETHFNFHFKLEPILVGVNSVGHSEILISGQVDMYGYMLHGCCKIAKEITNFMNSIIHEWLTSLHTTSIITSVVFLVTRRHEGIDFY